METPMDIGSREDWLRLHLIAGLGRQGLFKLIRCYGSPAAALAADPAEWRTAAGVRRDLRLARQQVDHTRLEATLKQLESLNVELVSYWDRHRYPTALRTIADPPALLYLRGQLGSDEAALAVVGSRKASGPGRRFTEQIASELAAAGICIVSGLARGIDTAAHRGALAVGGRTIAVLGCGIDRVYPPENDALFQQIAEQGAILSEYPPGAEPLAGHFPGRNRIISGLCRGVLVVEAATGSGSLLTVDFALESGREVFAVPNQVRTATSNGVNQLLKDGAHVVTDSRDILEVLWPHIRSGESSSRTGEDLPDMPEQQHKLLKLLSFNPIHRDQLLRTSGLTPMELSDSLLHLELSGHATQLPGGHYVRAR
ncbi:DNA-protecting protein DprA [Geothermobacter hydrogeniphilus]|uniref:DNA-protecting protein DprA n=2 Tax=Geothermobacter hydrogeniphilus TaxID=1969733 RepID=A0A2K2HDI9_9BACT|nr:DNA-protecting protein DprA [Geothermobacter hydrogeniphilus]